MGGFGNEKATCFRFRIASSGAHPAGRRSSLFSGPRNQNHHFKLAMHIVRDELHNMQCEN
jgi:hypothetical protein